MSNKYKIPLLIINLVLIGLLLINQNLSFYYIPVFCGLISLSIINRRLVIYLYLLFIVVTALINQSHTGSIISLINLALFTYLAWINWTNMSGKTFSVFRDINLRGTIILSCILQLLSMGIVFASNPDVKLIVINILLWCVNLGYFVSILLFIVRSIRCFSAFFVTTIIQLISFIVSALLINSFALINFLMVLLFVVYLIIILIYQKQRYKEK